MIIYENLLYNQDIAHVTEIKFPWYKLQNRSIMISGATGLIGSFLIDVLLEKNTQDGLNCTVYALGRNKEKAMERFSKHANNSHLIFIPYDVRLPLKIDNVGRVDYVLHGNDRAAMEQDFADRVQDYQRIYNVGIRQTEAPGLYKYYSTQRPVDIGTFPKPPYNKPDEIFNYDQRIPVENGSFLAWGYLTYTRPLTEKQASDYELRPAPDNPDRPRPIAEQMKNAAKLAEADRGSEAPAPQRRQPDRGDR